MDLRKYYTFISKYGLKVILTPLFAATNMGEGIKNRWVLLLVLVVFIIAKVPALHYPFYWDESWSYAPGVKLMYLHGPSLMPNAIDLGYSRGHPLLFYASAAAWMRLFGDSHIAQHSFSLFISCLLLVSIYEINLRLFNKRIAITSLLLVALQVIFFVQSTLLLPEIMVAWLSLLALYFYSTQKYLFTFISLTALMLTKESGLALGLVLGLHAVWQLFSKKETTAAKVGSMATVAGAAIVTGAFFLLQKKLNGWYLYPEHTGLIDLSWPMYKGKMRFCLEIILAHQYRSYLFGLLIFTSVVVAVAKRNIKYAYVAGLGLLFIILEGDFLGVLTRRVLIPVAFAAFIYVFYTLVNLNKEKTSATRFIYLCIFFIGSYLSFTCLNFFTNRYLVSALVVFLLLAAYAFDTFLRSYKPIVFYSFIGCLLLIATFAFKNNKGNGDVDLGIYSAMRVQEDVVTYLEHGQLYSHFISATSALEREHLTKPLTGFLHTPRAFGNVGYSLQANTEYFIIDNIQVDSTFSTDALKPDYYRVYRTQQGDAWAEIYKRK